MNILHHKSWHVRNKNNIAKVRAAEKKAREEEEAKEKRKLVAESEARINLLRTKARSGDDSKAEDLTSSTIAAILDGEEPSSVGKDRKNLDHEKEAKKDKEDWEKKVGILTYLGQGCEEDKPWYLLDHNSRMGLKETDPPKSADGPKTFLKSDPLIDIKRHLDTVKKNKAKETPPVPSTKVTVSSSVNVKVKQEVSQIKKEKKSGKRKHKKHRKYKNSSKKSRSSTCSDSSTSDESSSEGNEDNEIEKRAKLEALRAERFRREKAERERANKLLNKSTIPEPKVELDDRKRGYNSQFNPQLARQNLEKSK